MPAARHFLPGIHFFGGPSLPIRGRASTPGPRTPDQVSMLSGITVGHGIAD
jgi:hypothetical protein